MAKAEITELQAALQEVFQQRMMFSEASFDHIVRVLSEKIESLQRASSKLRTDEIRLVTVMFVDVVDSTKIARQLQHEWKFMLESIHQRLAQVVEIWRGEVGQYLGDGMLCFFGASHSQADDAARAVACALAVQREAVEASAWAQTHYQQGFAVRASIATGRVVVGLIGTPSKQELLAMGTATNLAFRLQERCPPGQVVIDAATYHAVRHRCTTQAMPPVRLRGFDGEIEYHLVSGWRQSAPLRHNSIIAGMEIPFVGRDDQLQLLRQQAHQAMLEETFHTLIIYGEMGIGKSRLLHESLEILDDGSSYSRILLAARYETRETPYHLLQMLIGDVCGVDATLSGSAALEHIRRQCSQFCAADQLEPMALALAKLIGVHPAEANEIHDLVLWAAHWLRAMGQHTPLLIGVDNLHWADPESLALLEMITVWLADCEGMLLCTARPEFRRSTPDFLRTAPHLNEITLGRLSDDDIRRMILAVLKPVAQVPPALIEHIFARADGNPLFVEQFLHMLFDSGVFERDEIGDWRTNRYVYGTLESKLPNGLLGVFQARLDDLPAATRKVAQAAAVLGDGFWAQAAAYLVDAEVAPLLDDLTGRGILLVEPDADERRFRFYHALLCEVAYEMLTRPDRAYYHRRAAEWLSTHRAGDSEALPDLARHWLLGGQSEAALQTYVAAVEDRAARGLYHEALRLVERGLDSARGLPREVALPPVCRLWQWQGLALNRLNRHAEASAAGQTALRLLAELPGDMLTETRAAAQRILAEADRSLHESEYGAGNR
jgi:class 3 adenylate cyclase/tetratricopeptide (TPR) repeat protein